MKIFHIVLLSIIISISLTPAYATTYTNATFTISENICNTSSDVNSCILSIEQSYENEKRLSEDYSHYIMLHDQCHADKIDITNQYNDFKSKQACNIDDYDMMQTDLNSFRDRLIIAEDKVEGYEDAIEYTHVETRQKLDACEYDLVRLINDKTTYVQHEDILHKFNKTATSTNSTLLINENNLLKQELSSMKLYVTAQNELMLEVIRIFNSNQTAN